jgi:hypothetical protein
MDEAEEDVLAVSRTLSRPPRPLVCRVVGKYGPQAPEAPRR